MIVVVLVSITLWVDYRSDYGFTTPKDGILNNSYTFYNSTTPYQLSAGQEYISDKIDIIYLLLLAGLLFVPIWAFIRYTALLKNQIEWSDMTKKEKMFYVIYYLIGIAVMVVYIVSAGFVTTKFIPILIYLIYVMVGIAITEILLLNFNFVKKRKRC